MILYEKLELEPMLTFERRWYVTHGNKGDAIAEVFGVPPEEYYVKLYEILDTPEAYKFDPLLVARLKRLREYRLGQRKIDASIGWGANKDGIQDPAL